MWLSSLLLLALSFISENSWAQDSTCLNLYEIGIQRLVLRENKVLVSVSRYELNSNHFDDVKSSAEFAEMEAKAQLGKHLNTNQLHGVRKISNCQSNGYVYIGVGINDSSPPTFTEIIRKFIPNSFE